MAPMLSVAAVAEARRVRTTGGILDASTLGKIEIAGPDAAAFLDTLHLSPASAIKVGRAKYMVSLREDGMVLDDGLMLRPGPQRFIATTSSSHADRVLSHYEHYRDIGWAGRRVTITDVTGAWAVIAVAGPSSRKTLLDVLGDAWRPRPSSDSTTWHWPWAASLTSNSRFCARAFRANWLSNCMCDRAVP